MPSYRWQILAALAATALCGVILLASRWQIAANDHGQIFRLDRWTGHVALCVLGHVPRGVAGAAYDCAPRELTDEEVSTPAK